jgi:hypothetical protein
MAALTRSRAPIPARLYLRAWRQISQIEPRIDSFDSDTQVSACWRDARRSRRIADQHSPPRPTRILSCFARTPATVSTSADSFTFPATMKKPNTLPCWTTKSR